MEEKDKKIVELETKLAKSEKERELDNSFWKQECDSLQKKLHDLPKKIGGEIRKQICEDCFWEECEEQHCEFYFIIEYLNAILKKYGGKK